MRNPSHLKIYLFTFLSLLLSGCGSPSTTTTTVINNVGDNQWSGLKPGRDAIILVSNSVKAKIWHAPFMIKGKYKVIHVSSGLFWKHNKTGDLLRTGAGTGIYRVAPGSYTIKHFEFKSGNRKYSGRVPGNITFRAVKGQITYVGHVAIDSTGSGGRVSASVKNNAQAARKVVSLKDKTMVSKIQIRLAH